MKKNQLEWQRWIAIIMVVALVANGAILPWPILAVGLAGGGGYLCLLGWRKVQKRGGGSSQVTYWRGQKIELPRSRSGVGTGGHPSLLNLRGLAPGAGYFVLGGALVLGAVAVILRQFGG